MWGPHAAWSATMAGPVCTRTLPHHIVVHGYAQVRHGDLAVTKIPYTAAIGSVELHVFVAVNDDVAMVLELHLANAHCFSGSKFRHGTSPFEIVKKSVGLGRFSFK